MYLYLKEKHWEFFFTGKLIREVSMIKLSQNQGMNHVVTFLSCFLNCVFVLSETLYLILPSSPPLLFWEKIPQPFQYSVNRSHIHVRAIICKNPVFENRVRQAIHKPSNEIFSFAEILIRWVHMSANNTL